MLNRGFAETMALKRSAGLETVACWQTDAQWIDREVRDQLDALFAHRVYFATASGERCAPAAELAMAEFSDTVRPGIEHLSALGRPDVRLHLPRHHAIASWVTPEGRAGAVHRRDGSDVGRTGGIAMQAAKPSGRGGRLRRSEPAALGGGGRSQRPPRRTPQPAERRPAPRATAGDRPARARRPVARLRRCALRAAPPGARELSRAARARPRADRARRRLAGAAEAPSSSMRATSRSSRLLVALGTC